MGGPHREECNSTPVMHGSGAVRHQHSTEEAREQCATMGSGAGGGKGGDQGEQAARHTYRTQSRARVSQTSTPVRPASRWATLGGPGSCRHVPKVGAGWGRASRPDLRRGCRVTGIPTAIFRFSEPASPTWAMSQNYGAGPRQCHRVLTRSTGCLRQASGTFISRKNESWTNNTTGQSLRGDQFFLCHYHREKAAAYLCSTTRPTVCQGDGTASGLLAAASRAWRSSAASRPELVARQRGAFGHGPHLCPADVRVDAVAVPAIGAGDDVLAPHDPGVGHDAIRDQFGGSIVVVL